MSFTNPLCLHWTYLVIELSTYFFAVILFYDSRKHGLRWVSSYLTAMVFGLAVELTIVLMADPEGTHYQYGTFLVMFGPSGKMVPAWVGVGWGVIVYSAMWTAQKLRVRSWVFRPMAAALLAVNIDLSLDPIAHQLGFWRWKNVESLNYYGVAFDNFLGWFLIVASFSFCVRLGFRVIPRNARCRECWIPPLGALVSVVAMIPVRAAVPIVYDFFDGETIPFAVIFMVACGITWIFALRSDRNHPRCIPVLAVPLYFHALLLLMLFVTESYKNEPTLIVVIPLNLLVGFFAYAWLSLDELFPQPPRMPQLTLWERLRAFGAAIKRLLR